MGRGSAVAVLVAVVMSATVVVGLPKASAADQATATLRALPKLVATMTSKKFNSTGSVKDHRLAAILSKLTALKADIIAQNDAANDRTRQELVTVHAEIDKLVTTLEAISGDLEDVQQGKDMISERLAEINSQLFGPNAADEDNVDVSALSLDLDEDSPEGLPHAATGSVVAVVRMVWDQLIALKDACQVDGEAHTRRASIRPDIEGINTILSLINDANSKDQVSGCPICNSSVCRQVQVECVVDMSDKSLPVDVKPDLATCWYLLDNYCGTPYGQMDPGCGCNASTRCWDATSSIGRCPVMSSSDGSTHCTDVGDLQCDDYYENAGRIYQAAALSAQDEELVNALRDFRKEVLMAPPTPVAEGEARLTHCQTDMTSLKRHFARAEEIALSLWGQRADVAADLQVITTLVESKAAMHQETDEVRTQLLQRVALETQVQTEREKETEQQLQAIELALNLLSGVGAGINKASEINSGKRAAATSCQEHLKADPTLPDGIYWVTMGQTEAVRVYCDMSTDGGGWTMVWKNVGGAVDTTARLQHKSNHDLITSPDTEDIVTPSLVDHKAQINSAAYNYYATRPNQEWAKTMTLFRGPQRAIATQRVRVEFNGASMGEVFGVDEGCQQTSDTMAVYSSRRQIMPVTASPSDYLMGLTRTVISRRGQSYGLGNVGTFEDMCADRASPFLSPEDVCAAVAGKVKDTPTVAEPLVCDMQMLVRLDNATSSDANLTDHQNLTTVGNWEIVRHLFSYMHKAPNARQASRCMYRCWDDDEDDDGYNEVFVWMARGRCPVNDDGLTCSNHGTCKESICQCDPGYTGETCSNKLQCTDPLTAINHAQQVGCSGSGEYGDTCSYACDVGYRLDVGGTLATSTCGVTGWSDITATCNPVECGTFTGDDVAGPGAASTYCTGMHYKDICTITCDHGHRLSIDANGVTCSATGEWVWNMPVDAGRTAEPILVTVSQTPGSCQVVTCPALVDSEQTVTSCNTATDANDEYLAGTTCTSHCIPNHRPSGSTSRTCAFDSKFDGTPLTCAPVHCPAPAASDALSISCGTPEPVEVIPNVVSDIGYSSGDRCTFQCNTGYELAGATAANCSAVSGQVDTYEWQYGTLGAPSCIDMFPCKDTICSAVVPSCASGMYVLPKRMWNGCCFNRETDCVQFERFVVFEIGTRASEDKGVLSENILRRSIANLTNVNPHDVTIQKVVEVLTSESYVVRTIAVAPASNSTKETDPAVLLHTTTDILVEGGAVELLATMADYASEISTIEVFSAPQLAPRVPTDVARAVHFIDEDGRAGWLRGEMIVHAAVEASVATTGYTVYFGDGAGSGLLNRVGDAVGTTLVEQGPLGKFNLRATEVPRGARDWLVFSINHFAMSATGYTTPINLVARHAEDPLGSLSFVDGDPRRGWVRGVVHCQLWGIPPDATGITDIVVYFGSGGNNQTDKTGNSIGETTVSANGPVQVEIPSAVPIPANATHFMAFARNVDMESQHAIIMQFDNSFAHRARSAKVVALSESA